MKEIIIENTLRFVEDDVYNYIKKIEKSTDRTALLKEANRLLAEIVEDGILGQKWTKQIDDFLSRADQPWHINRNPGYASILQ